MDKRMASSPAVTSYGDINDVEIVIERYSMTSRSRSSVRATRQGVQAGRHPRNEYFQPDVNENVPR